MTRRWFFKFAGAALLGVVLPLHRLSPMQTGFDAEGPVIYAKVMQDSWFKSTPFLAYLRKQGYPVMEADR